jgi:acetolactate synthase small subunit
MHAFHIHYRNTQGTLMRILNAISRRAIDMPYVQAEPHGYNHKVSLLLELNPKQIGQLFRDWHAIVDVVSVSAGAPTEGMMELAERWDAARHPPVAASSGDSARAAMA